MSTFRCNRKATPDSRCTNGQGCAAARLYVWTQESVFQIVLRCHEYCSLSLSCHLQMCRSFPCELYRNRTQAGFGLLQHVHFRAWHIVGFQRRLPRSVHPTQPCGSTGWPRPVTGKKGSCFSPHRPWALCQLLLPRLLGGMRSSWRRFPVTSGD